MEEVELLEFLVEGGVVDGLGMKLLLDEGAEAHFLNHFHVAGAGAESDAVKDVDDFIAVGGGWDRGNRGRIISPAEGAAAEEKAERDERESKEGRLSHGHESRLKGRRRGYTILLANFHCNLGEGRVVSTGVKTRARSIPAPVLCFIPEPPGEDDRAI